MRERRESDAPQDLNMTPMIDVVFQLLVFFVVTMEPMDVLTHLPVLYPGSPAEPVAPQLDFIKIGVGAGGELSLSDRRVSLAQLEERLNTQVGVDPTIMIRAHDRSTHQQSVVVMNLCQKLGLTHVVMID